MTDYTTPSDHAFLTTREVFAPRAGRRLDRRDRRLGRIANSRLLHSLHDANRSGDAHVDRADSARTSFTRDFQELITGTLGQH